MAERVALITGGTSGIGAACVRRLAVDGCRVAFTYRSDAEAAAELADEVGATAYQLDLVDAEAQAEVLSRLEAEVGRVTVLVHNAGATRDTLLPFLTEETWDAILDVNLHAVYRLTRALIRGMLQARWGRVITIASLSGVIGHAGQAHYSAAKAGLIGFTKAVALEGAKFNVTANAVAPGFIDTDMLAAIPEAKMKAYLEAIPLRRMGRPDEVSALVGYLASDAAAYMTGQTLRLDGGLVMA
ncbi:MAG: 3-oxoacyl-ACP reductase FabG [Acidobacteriota bacterium]